MLPLPLKKIQLRSKAQAPNQCDIDFVWHKGLHVTECVGIQYIMYIYDETLIESHS